MARNLGELHWHDGLVRSISFEMHGPRKSTVTLSVALYDNLQSPQRFLYDIICTGVTIWEATVDVDELHDNASAGNIGDGSYEERTLALELTGGKIQIHAKAFDVKAG
jgi:hypothetical protein